MEETRLTNQLPGFTPDYKPEDYTVASQLAKLDDTERKKYLKSLVRSGQIQRQRDGALSEFVKGAAGTALELQKSFANTIKETTGWDSFDRWASQVVANNQQYAPYEGYKALSLNPSDIARTVAQGAVQSIGSIAAGAAATALSGGNLAAGGAAGASVMFAQLYGDRVQEYRDEIPKADDGTVKSLAFISALGESLIETAVGPEQIALRIGKNIAKNTGKNVAKGIVRKALVDTMKNQGARAFVKKMAVEGAKSFATEGLEEVVQDLWNNMVKYAWVENGKILPSLEEAGETFMGGAWSGLFLGASGGAFENIAVDHNNPFRRNRNAKEETAEEVDETEEMPEESAAETVDTAHGETPVEMDAEIVPEEEESEEQAEPIDEAKNEEEVGISKDKNGNTRMPELTPISDLNIDAERFQFKSGHNKSGVVHPIEGEFDQTQARPLYVWEDKEGKKFVVEGHHRLDLAQRSGVKDILTYTDKESEGVTWEQARETGIWKNIKDNQGSVEDYASYFRGSKITEEQAKKQGFFSGGNDSKGRKGFTIGRFASDNLYQQFKDGDINADKVEIIADVARGDEGLEAAGIRVAKNMPKEQLRDFMNCMKNMPREKNEDGDLFGFDDSAIQLSEQLSKAASKHINEIKNKLGVARRAVKNPEVAAKGDVKVGKNAQKLYDDSLKELNRWEHWYTDHELTERLKKEIGVASEEVKAEESKKEEPKAKEEPKKTEPPKVEKKEEVKKEPTKEEKKEVKEQPKAEKPEESDAKKEEKKKQSDRTEQPVVSDENKHKMNSGEQAEYDLAKSKYKSRLVYSIFNDTNQNVAIGLSKTVNYIKNEIGKMMRENIDEGTRNNLGHLKQSVDGWYKSEDPSTLYHILATGIKLGYIDRADLKKYNIDFALLDKTKGLIFSYQDIVYGKRENTESKKEEKPKERNVSEDSLKNLARTFNVELGLLDDGDKRLERRNADGSKFQIGGYFSADENKIYVARNGAGGYSPVFIFGHELYHQLSKNQFKYFAQFAKVMTDSSINMKGYSEFVRLKELYDGAYYDGRNEDGSVLEEMCANFLGYSLEDPDFIVKICDRMEALKKGSGASLLTTLHDVIKYIKSKINGVFGYRDIFYDFNKVQNALEDAIARYFLDVYDESISDGERNFIRKNYTEGKTTAGYHKDAAREEFSKKMYGLADVIFNSKVHGDAVQDKAEIIQEMVLKALKAYDEYKFDESKGVDEKTYYSTVMTNAMNDELNKVSKRNKETVNIGDEEVMEGIKAENEGNDTDQGGVTESQEQIEDIKRYTDPVMYQLMYFKTILKKSNAELARMYHVSEKTIAGIIEHAQMYLRSFLKNKTPYESIYTLLTSGAKKSEVIEAIKKIVPVPKGYASEKFYEEYAEIYYVARAMAITHDGGGYKSILKKLIDLYNNQIKLDTRTVGSKERQAFSTPIPLAYMLQHWLGIDKLKGNEKVLEPTAGNGALVMSVPYDKLGNVYVNEIDDLRHGNMMKLGFVGSNSTKRNAVVDREYFKSLDVDYVIANPPFGKNVNSMGVGITEYITENGSQYPIERLEHMIAYNALRGMKKDGKAALIFGAKWSPASKENPTAHGTPFENWLYGKYNIKDAFIVGGDLYAKQGTTYPVHVVLIDGMRDSFQEQFAQTELDVLTSWEDINNRLTNKHEGVQNGQENTEGKHVLGNRSGGGVSGVHDDRQGHSESGEVGVGAGALGLRERTAEGGVGTGGERGLLDREPGGTRSAADVSVEQQTDEHKSETMDRGSSGTNEGGSSSGEHGGHQKSGSVHLSQHDNERSVEHSIYNPSFGANNKIVTRDEALAALERIKKKLNRLNLGIDPEITTDLIKVGAYYIEGGVRKFSEYAKRMFDLMGEKIIPYLRGSYLNIKADVDMDSFRSEMDSEETVYATDLQSILGKDYEERRQEEKKQTKKQTEAKQTVDTNETEKSADGLNQKYKPVSSSYTLDTYLPANLHDPIMSALYKLKDEVGDLDNYVANKCGYESVEDMHKYLSAEQVDAVALAIYQIEKGSSLIIGDQTGVGKGRQAAAIQKYCINNNMFPVFITKNSGLLSDMCRDCLDIQEEGSDMFVKPFLICNDKSYSLKVDDIERYRGVPTKQQKKYANEWIKNGTNSEGYNAIWTSYPQLSSSFLTTDTGSTKDMKNKWQQEIIYQLSKNSKLSGGKNIVYVLDEAHSAAGAQMVHSETEGDQIFGSNTSKFLTKAMNAGNAKGSVFLSATYAKRNDNLLFYMLNNVANDVYEGNAQEVVYNALTKGEDSARQIYARSLASAGQLISRVKSFDGVEIKSAKIQLNEGVKTSYDRLAEVLRKLCIFSKMVSLQQSAFKNSAGGMVAQYAMQRIDELNEQRAREGKSGAYQLKIDTNARRGTSTINIATSEFASSISNYVDQIMFALKSESCIDKVLEYLKKGEKVSVGFINTMESFIKAYAEENDINAGDEFSVTFFDILKRTIDNQRFVSVKVIRPDGDYENIKVKIPWEKYGPAVIQFKNQCLDLTENVELNCKNAGVYVPVSPIDYIISKLKKHTTKGLDGIERPIRTCEITGRTYYIDYSEDKPILRKREESTKDRTREIFKYNDGFYDVMFLNAAGATGFSIHAGAKFKDQRKRAMILMQTSNDINEVVQLLGRINRSGQVTLPEYLFLSTDLQAEKRAYGILEKKMQSLSSNVSANKTSATDFGEVMPNIFDRYGDEAVRRFASSNLEFAGFLNEIGYGVTPSNNDSLAVEHGTGAFAQSIIRLSMIMPNYLQEEMYDDIVIRYKEFVEYAKKLGTYREDIVKEDWDASLIKSAKIEEAKGDYEGSQIGAPITINTYSTTEKKHIASKYNVENEYRKNYGVKDGNAAEFEKAVLDSIPTMEDFERYCNSINKKPDWSETRDAESRLRNIKNFLDNIAGKVVEIKPKKDSKTITGTLTKVTFTTTENPTIYSNVKLRFLTTDAIHEDFPLSKYWGKERSNEFSFSILHSTPLENVFGEESSVTTTNKRMVFEGDLIKSLYLRGDANSRIIKFTDSEGNEHEAVDTRLDEAGINRLEEVKGLTLKDDEIEKYIKRKSPWLEGCITINDNANYMLIRVDRFRGNVSVRVSNEFDIPEEYLNRALKKGKYNEIIFEHAEMHTIDTKGISDFFKSLQQENEIINYVATDRSSLSAIREDAEQQANGDKFFIVDDKEQKRLDKEEYIRVYRYMQIGPDGKLHSPMAGVIDGNWGPASELGKWEMAEEHPELLQKDKNGQIIITPGAKGEFNHGHFGLSKNEAKKIGASYNPYIHTSNSLLNDQFKEAWNRPELVAVEVLVPKSEMTSGYRAKYAKNATGLADWKSGEISEAIAKNGGEARRLFLSRWDKPVRIIPWSEVAQNIKDTISGTDIHIMDSRVPPQLLKELKKIGVPIESTGDIKHDRLERHMSKSEAKEYLKGTKARITGNDETALFTIKRMGNGDIDVSISKGYTIPEEYRKYFKDQNNGKKWHATMDYDDFCGFLDKINLYYTPLTAESLESVRSLRGKQDKFLIVDDSKQVNPIRNEGELRNIYQRILNNRQYNAVTDKETTAMAEQRIKEYGGFKNVIDAVRRGDFPLFGAVNQRVIQLTLNSEDFMKLDMDDKVKIFYMDMGTEAGRNLASRRLGALDIHDIDSVNEHIQRFMAKIYKQDRDMVKRIVKAVKDKFGIDLTGKITKEDIKDPNKIYGLIQTLCSQSATIGDKVYEYWINAILSGPTTHAANIFGNIANMVYEEGIKRFTEASLNLISGKKGGASFADFKVMMKVVPWREAFQKAKFIYDMEGVGSTSDKIEQANIAIGGKLGRFVRIPTRALRAADEFAKAIIQPVESMVFACREARALGYTGNVASEYIRKQIKDVNSMANRYGTQRALKLTFQENPGHVVNSLMALRDKEGSMVGRILKYLFPFIKTPTNIIKQGVRKSPLGVFHLAGEAYRAVRKGEITDSLTEAAAEQLLAWGCVMALAAMSDGEGDDDKPFITGSSSSNWYKKQWMANKIPPYSIKIGGKYFSYRRIEPLSTMLALMADGINNYKYFAKGGSSGVEAMKMAFHGAKEIIADKSYFNTFGQINDVLNNPETSMAQWLTNFASGWMPAAARQLIQAYHDDVPDNKVRSFGKQFLVDNLIVTTNRMGITSASPKIDYFGREIKKDMLYDSSGLTKLLRFIPISGVDPDENMTKADELLWRYNQSHEDSQYYPNIPVYWYKKQGKTYYLTGKDYTDFAIEAGKLAYKQINNAFARGMLNYRNPGDDDIALIKKIFSDARSVVREKFHQKRRYVTK